ncbi:hypothetical protein EYZ11_009707 [Aspergillus tanneri]|uniref:Uncharacterized protein n=1 Tax=Aspergillus tanneri TaxID=1220188 RepID=A0A4S3JCK2_9EURO|nr:hypothetical protein EYZ11_009707 [Aspergillus tanneri]
MSNPALFSSILSNLPSWYTLQSRVLKSDLELS